MTFDVLSPERTFSAGVDVPSLLRLLPSGPKSAREGWFSIRNVPLIRTVTSNIFHPGGVIIRINTEIVPKLYGNHTIPVNSLPVSFRKV